MRRIRNKIARSAVVLSALLVSAACSQELLNVYSHRHYEIDHQVNRLFTEKTGIEVRVVNAEADQLIERLKSEGENSPADILVTVDAGRMQRAKSEGLLQPFSSETLAKATPGKLRDPDDFWYPYTIRARVILIARDRVKPGEIQDYEDLAKPEWKGRLLIRSSSSSYNQSLAASLVTALGEEKAREWAKGIAKNLARPPQGGDRDQIKACAAGLADVCVSNTYYFGLLLNSPDPAERTAAEKMSIVFPNQDGRGAHVNVSAAGIVKHARNVDNARAYLEFLVTPEVQKLIANGSYEYPVSMDLSLCATHARWGEFKIDVETFPKMGEDQPKAVRLFDAAGWK
ncbi:MAG TPA: extracellular solute-binding protein [Verrucomicrobiales bacterium]|nr:extracellular solute-binding protein [Verrucomicrobiales bacterium]